jgi:hypothetical protein
VTTGDVPRDAGVAPNIRLRPVAAGYGGVGPQSRPPSPDLWTVVFLEVESSARLVSVEVVELVLLDAAGSVVARTTSPRDVRRDTGADASARRFDYGDNGTVPFDGLVDAAVATRLRVHAALDTRAESLPGKPVRFRAVLRADGVTKVAVEGAVDGPWPTG